MAGTGIDKAQFGTFYAQARAKVLTTAAARKAFQDCGMTVHPSPTRVLNRLAGSTTPGQQTRTTQPATQEQSANMQSDMAFNNMLDAYKNTEDARDARALKWSLLEAYQRTQMENTAVWEENKVLRTHEERNRQIAKRKVPRVATGDRKYLSTQRMITREHAEQELIAMEPEIAAAQEQGKRKGKGRATPDDDEDDDNNDEELLALLPTPSPPPPFFLDVLDDGEPLSAIENTDSSQSAFYDTVPHASTSRHQL